MNENNTSKNQSELLNKEKLKIIIEAIRNCNNKDSNI